MRKKTIETKFTHPLRILFFACVLAFLALGTAYLMRMSSFERKIEMPVQQPTVSIPPPPETPVVVMPHPVEIKNESSEYKSKDGITSVILRLQDADVVTSGTWMTNGISVLRMYGTSTAFENQISWQLKDGNGRELGNGSITLNSSDVALSGSFSVDRAVFRLPSTSTGELVVFEASAKDGSHIHDAHIPIQFLCLVSCEKKVVLHFMKKNKMADCVKTIPVERKVFVSSELNMQNAMSELFSGPTAFEMSKGYVTTLIPTSTLPQFMSMDKTAFDAFVAQSQGACASSQIMNTAKVFISN